MAAATSSYQEKALALEQEANMSYTLQGNRRFAELTLKAANFYIAARKHKEAADAYFRAAQCFTLLVQPHDAMTIYISASNAYKVCDDTEKAARSLELAVDYYVAEGRFSIAAKYHEDLAGMYEQLKDDEGVVRCWEAAANFYEIENAAGSAARCRAKVAEHAALAGDYRKARGIFRNAFMVTNATALLRGGAYGYLFNSRLCLFLIGGYSAVEDELRSVSDGQLIPGTQPASKFVHNMLAAFKSNDPDQFSQVVNDYNRIYKLTEWQAAMMLRIGELFPEDEEGEKEE